ncbi:MAG: hypothetical protein ACXAC7_13785 [Candidatus Hodarchaeales archaeon]
MIPQNKKILIESNPVLHLPSDNTLVMKHFLPSLARNAWKIYLFKNITRFFPSTNLITPDYQWRNGLKEKYFILPKKLFRFHAESLSLFQNLEIQVEKTPLSHFLISRNKGVFVEIFDIKGFRNTDYFKQKIQDKHVFYWLYFLHQSSNDFRGGDVKIHVNHDMENKCNKDCLTISSEDNSFVMFSSNIRWYEIQTIKVQSKKFIPSLFIIFGKM